MLGAGVTITVRSLVEIGKHGAEYQKEYADTH